METEKTATKKPTKKPAKKPTKKPTAKKVKAASEKNIPTSGQSGPPIDVPFERLNDKEKGVLSRLNKEATGTREILTIEVLSMESDFGEDKPPSEKTANSWTRNSLRRLARGGWIEKPARGTYRISTKGRNRLAPKE